jgi:uridine kinase
VREALLQLLAELLLERRPSHPLRVAIDGPDCSGKTTLADELAELLAGERPLIRAGIDGFHNPRELRYRRGADSPEGYFFDSFDYEAVRTQLLEPLGPGGSRRFDYRLDEKIELPEEKAAADAVLLFDGVFLLRSELLGYWDFSIFVYASFEEILRRSELRDCELLGGEEATRARYLDRYLPGQELYLRRSEPHQRADVLIDNTVVAEPKLLKRP